MSNTTSSQLSSRLVWWRRVDTQRLDNKNNSPTIQTFLASGNVMLATILEMTCSMDFGHAFRNQRPVGLRTGFPNHTVYILLLAHLRLSLVILTHSAYPSVWQGAYRAWRPKCRVWIADDLRGQRRQELTLTQSLPGSNVPKVGNTYLRYLLDLLPIDDDKPNPMFRSKDTKDKVPLSSAVQVW